MATGSLHVNQDIILATKKQHIKQLMQKTPVDAVLALAQMQDRPRGLLNYSTDNNQVMLIAQITRHEVYDPITSALHCIHNGADAVAFFTDHSIYPDDLDDLLMLSRGLLDFPVLFQNYLFNEYGVMATRASGASGVFAYGTLLDRDTLRKIVSMAQRWKMSTIIQVIDEDDLVHALRLSPHVISFGDNLSGNVATTIEEMQALRHLVPHHCKTMLTQTLHDVAEVEMVLDAGVDALIVDEMALKHHRTADRIRELVQSAEATRHDKS